jgi:hypothetical protein
MSRSVTRLGEALHALLPGRYLPAPSSEIARIEGNADSVAWQREITNGAPLDDDGNPRPMFGYYRLYSIDEALVTKGVLAARGRWPTSWLPLLGFGPGPERVIAVDMATTCVHAWTHGHTWRVASTLDQFSETLADVLEPLVAAEARLEEGWEDLWYSDAVLAAVDETLSLRGTPVMPPPSSERRALGVDDITRAHVRTFASAARRLVNGLFVPAGDLASVDARWPIVPTALRALYLEVCDGDPLDARWYGLGRPVRLFDEYRWIRAREIGDSADDLANPTRHPDWHASWIPFLSSDWDVIAVESTPSGAVWRYDFKERGADRITESLVQWLDAASVILSELAVTPRVLGSPWLMRRIEDRLRSSSTDRPGT